MITITLSRLNDISKSVRFFYSISSTEIRSSIIYPLKSLVPNLDDFGTEYTFKFNDVVVKANYNFKTEDFELTFANEKYINSITKL